MAVSTLLFVTCLSCTSSAPDPIPVLDPPCPPEKHPNLAGQSTDATPSCISTPEVAALPALKFNYTEQPSSMRMVLQPTPESIEPERLSSVTWSSEIARPKSNLLLQPGSQGESVADLQTRLHQLGYYSGAMDGVYGPLTQTAVIRFQQAQQLNPDGVVGTETWAVLHRLSAPPNSITSPATTSPSPPKNPVTTKQPLPAQAADSSSHRNRAIYVSPSPSQIHLWLTAGWVIIYVGGWVLIFKDYRKELRGVKISSTSRLAKDFDSTPSHSTAQPQLTDKRPTVQPKTQQRAQVSPHSISEQAPVIASSSTREKIAQSDASQATALTKIEHSDRTLPVTLADEGRIQPLQNLFVGLNQLSSAHSAVKPNSSAPVRKQSSITQPQSVVESQVVSTASHTPQVSDGESSDNEMLVATLSSADGDQPDYTYFLIEDAGGLFVLRGNELRLVRHLLQETQETEQLITLRRVDSQGNFIDESFKLAIHREPQPSESELIEK